jgi:RimJ/RimL family protein N-acetyltransferase
MSRLDSPTQLLSSANTGRTIPVPIITTRLELRPFKETDTDGIAQLLADREATQFIGDVKTREAAAESVRAMRDAHAMRGWGTLAVFRRGEHECVGYCGVRPLPHTAELEVAFALRRQSWNMGYATEAASASIDAAFKHLGVPSIVATVYPANKASLRVLAKLGMTLETEVFGHWPMTTALLFRIAREEWQSRANKS